MSPEQMTLVTLGALTVAVLYSSVGHAGASGYIAVMTLAGLAPEFIRPTALLLNILVASLTTYQFYRAGHFSWRLFWPFAVMSVPCAFLGGYLSLPTPIFKIVIGIVLLYSALRFFINPRPDGETRSLQRPLALILGAVLGLVSGLTGVGGGIFLTPLLLFTRWAKTKTAAAVSALFILVNSISGLLGNVSNTKQIPALALPLAAAVILGGAAGSYMGSRRLSPVLIKRLLACVLTIAGIKLIMV